MQAALPSELTQKAIDVDEPEAPGGLLTPALIARLPENCLILRLELLDPPEPVRTLSEGLDKQALRQLARRSPPPQHWFDADEERPF